MRWASLGLALAALLPFAGARAATYQGRGVDGRWYEGRAVSTTYGAYDCDIRFNGERVYMRLRSRGVQIVGILEDEAISDPHDITVDDPARGVIWSLDCFDLAH